MKVEQNLQALGIELPVPPSPVAAYVPCRQAGSLVYVSGQLPMIDGKLLMSGRVGVDVTPEQGNQAARLCGLNIVAQLKRFLGDLDRVKAVVQVIGYVACDNTFAGHPQVMNGVSELMVDVFGEAGRHTRYALGANSLPLNAPVEVGAIVEIDL